MKKSTPPPSYIDPSSLSLPSPASDVSSPIHVASTSSADTPSATPSTSTAQPPRKRQRTDTSPEEKREARAHRNRIAAQNSRDRRKLQFSQLEENVRLLKQENEQLRAELQRERERRDNAEKDKENAELKERVKSLEQGWEAVVKALQSQGLPSSFSASKPPSSPSPDPKSDPPTTTFPVFINAPIAFPPTPLSVASSHPTVDNQPASNDGSIRHLAADGSIHSPALSTFDLDAPYILLQETFGDSHSSSENRIEHWFSQMLSTNTSSSSNNPLSTPSSHSLSTLGHDKDLQQCRAETSPTASPSLIPLDLPSGSMSEECLGLGLKDDIEMAMEMDQLFDLLPDTVNRPTVNSEEFQDLLASVLDESTVVESSSGKCDWSLGLRPHTTDPETISASLVVV